MYLPGPQKNSGIYIIIVYLFIFLIIVCPLLSSAQSDYGILKGVVYNAASGHKISGAAILADSNKSVSTYADGSYSMQLKKGKHLIIFSANGFQRQSVSEVTIYPGETAEMNIVLVPVSLTGRYKGRYNPAVDSVTVTDSIRYTYALSVLTSVGLRSGLLTEQGSDYLRGTNIQPGIDRDASLLLKRLNFVTVFDQYTNQQLQTITAGGMDQRYNQLLLNGLPLNSFNPLSNAYPLSAIPVESVKEVSVQTLPNATIPANFAGATVHVKTKDIPERNFLYILGGAGSFNNFDTKTYYTDQKSNTQILGFTGNKRQLPSSMPTIRSRTLYHQLNPQIQTDLARQMNNNIAPVQQSTALPNNRIVLGFGRVFKIKKNQLGVTAYVQQQKTQHTDITNAQVVPNTTGNPYPFTELSIPVAGASSIDTSYRYASQLSAIVNAGYVTSKSKISFRNLFISQFYNSFTKRTQLLKPDEDPGSRTGLHYLTEQRTGFQTQLGGEHILGTKSNVKLDWEAAYTNYKLTEPDERSILLSQNPANSNEYKIAAQSTASVSNPYLRLLNTGRSWRSTADQYFNGGMNISVPFKALGYTQLIKAGMLVQSVYREFSNDHFLIRQNDNSFSSMNQLLAPERYFPSGITVENFYKKIEDKVQLRIAGLSTSGSVIRPVHFGNYLASSNTGATYIQLHSRLAKNLEAIGGVRAESNNQLVSNLQYEYTESFRNPELYRITLNSRNTKYHLLPHLQLSFTPVRNVQLYASYSKTVNRPQIRELANVFTQQPLSFLVTRGNAILEDATINHYNAGVNWGFAANSHFSVNGFYRVIQRPIESLVSAYSSGYLISRVVNTPNAYISGMQAALKLNLYSIAKIPFLSYISLFANGNITNSTVTAGPVKDFQLAPIPFGQELYSLTITKHTLTGTPAYTVNGGITVAHPRWPCLNIMYQETADYLQAIGTGEAILLSNGNMIPATPNLRVARRSQMDVQVSQKIVHSSFQISAGVNNLLQTPFVQYQDLNGNNKFDTPLQVDVRNNGAFYRIGTDNTIVNIKTQRYYYLTISYLFK